jgi:two-component system sensor histidine kinase AlgZ
VAARRGLPRRVGVPNVGARGTAAAGNEWSQRDVPFTTQLAQSGLITFGLVWLALGVLHTGAFYFRYREREAHARELGGQLRDAQLHALRTQLHPHFLFNTLNAAIHASAESCARDHAA